jgi:hypothetical protein
MTNRHIITIEDLIGYNFQQIVASNPSEQKKLIVEFQGPEKHYKVLYKEKTIRTTSSAERAVDAYNFPEKYHE